MTPWWTLSFALARAGAANAAAAVHAGVTIAQRLPSFGAPSLTPPTTAAAQAEVERAYTEKVTAFWRGGLEAGLAWQRLGLDLATGSVRPEAVPTRLLAVSEAASRPARRKVRSNARRLTRPKP